MTLSIEEIQRIIKQNQDFIESNFKVSSLKLFGSYSRDEQNETSDVDILVEFTQPVSFFLFLELQEFLEKILLKKVDLTTINSLKPYLKEKVLKEAKTI